jgi:uncharacterized protein YgbK (DUF1537 family)
VSLRDDAVLELKEASSLLNHGPAPLIIDGARAQIRQANEAAQSWVIVLDDDPTGSQSVQDVPVLTSWSADDLAWAFGQPGRGFFILTNTRGLNEFEARAVLEDVAAGIAAVAAESNYSYSLITRSDSTMRGHYPLETDVLIGLAEKVGRPYSALLLAPAYIAAGRVTVDDVHYVRDGDTFFPVGHTSYSRDATFHFESSDIRDYVEEKTGGQIAATTVRSLSLDDIRVGGPQRVCDVILSCMGSTPIVVNATTDSDLDVVALGLALAESAGARVLCRTGPSFVAARLGIGGRGPLSHDEIFAAGQRSGHGLIIVGSHVELTTRQVARLTADLTDVETIEVNVPRLLDAELAANEIQRCTKALVSALGRTDALLVSSREQIIGDSGHSSLVIAQTVSSALVDLTKAAVKAVPLKWVLAKGGITSSDIATAGLHIRRATVIGQLFPGIVSAWVNEGAGELGLEGLPYVVFAGNVGDDETLAEAVSILRGGSR